MSLRWPNSIVNKTLAAPTDNFSSSAPGEWKLDAVAQYVAQGVWPSGATAIEDVFSTYLYTGNGSTQTINNGIQLGDSYSAGVTGGGGLFNGSTNYLSVPTGSALNLSGDFTIECWVYQSSAGIYSGIFSNGDYPASAQVVFTLVGGVPYLYMANGTNWVVALNAASAIPLNTYTHVAVTANGTLFTLWVNGVSVASSNISITRATPAATSVIGRLYSSTNDYYLNGYVSNLRVVKGTALYTSNFTVPSSALTAVSGTQLLCLQGASPFVDNSPNALTITNYGTTASSTGPFPYTLVPGDGGMVWIKARNYDSGLSAVLDTTRGATKRLSTNLTDAEYTNSAGVGVTSFNSNGFSLGTGSAYNSAYNYASWTFRKAPKFFDVVTYTGNGSTQNINHTLGVAPGLIYVKCTSAGGTYWVVYHRSLGSGYYLLLNTSDAAGADGSAWNNTTPTASVFTVGTNSQVNTSGATYVAYLFAHDTDTDGLIQCGSYSGSATSTSVTLGWEPQILLIKRTDSTGDWQMIDTMRGMSQTAFNVLAPNLSAAEVVKGYPCPVPTATGFDALWGNAYINNGAGSTYIYMAIRRGPMRTPTDGTKVFSPIAANNSTGTQNTTGFPVDLQLQVYRPDLSSRRVFDRLRGISSNTTASGITLLTESTAAEFSDNSTLYWGNTGFQTPSVWNTSSMIYWNFQRAPGFFDVVCYTGTGSARTVNHNLGVAPELMIVKYRVSSANWFVYNKDLGSTKGLYLNLTNTPVTSTSLWNNTEPTTSVFTLGTSSSVNTSGGTYVAYLFASCPGVSKVGSYTGTGATQTISCGFTGGARFVLIKRTDSTGDWYVWDTARGMVAGTDPSLLLNSTAAEVNANSVYTTTGGFQIVSTAAGINASGGSYIYLAIA